jgi:hypothetical protein
MKFHVVLLITLSTSWLSQSALADIPPDGELRGIHIDTGGCMQVENLSREKKTPVKIQSPCRDKGAWKLESYSGAYRIVSATSGMCLDVTDFS